MDFFLDRVCDEVAPKFQYLDCKKEVRTPTLELKTTRSICFQKKIKIDWAGSKKRV